jgi:hypothetical protein
VLVERLRDHSTNTDVPFLIARAARCPWMDHTRSK